MGTRTREDDPIDVIEVQAAVLTRNFELIRRRRDRADELDRAEYLLLRALLALGANHINPLAEALGLDPSTVGRQVAVLEEHGLVERQPDPADRRCSVVTISELGRDRMATTSLRRAQRTKELLDGWTDEDLRTLGEMFTRYNQAVARAYLTTIDQLT